MIGGGTASGKTGLAIRLALHFKTFIVSADSRQFYREMQIGAAPPTAEEQALVPHYFVQDRSVTQPLNASDYAQEALPLLERLFQEHDVVVMVGGSGLFIKAVTEGFHPQPPADEALRKELKRVQEEQGLERLQQRLQELDPEAARAVDLQNPRRIIRAIEIITHTGRPLSQARQQPKEERPFQVHKLAIDWPREELYSRINQRCEEMLRDGLLEEVREFYPLRHHKPLQTIGYSEFFRWLEGEWTLECATEKFKQHTRNYAKRQLTWFRKEEDLRWFMPQELEQVVPWVEERVGS